MRILVLLENDNMEPNSNSLQISKNALDKHIEFLREVVEWLVPNNRPFDISFIEQNISHVSDSFSLLWSARDMLWFHWENIIMSDLSREIKDAFFSSYWGAFMFNYNRFHEDYNEQTFEKAKNYQSLYTTPDLKNIAYSVNHAFKNDILQFERFQKLYKFKIEMLTPLRRKIASAETNVYQIAEDFKAKKPISFSKYYELINVFRHEYLDKKKFHERIELHRKPNEVRSEVLQHLNSYLLQIQGREEMQDIDHEQGIHGYVPTKLVDIWQANRKLRSGYDAIIQYCNLTNKDFNTIAIHTAEYRAMNKLFAKINRDIYAYQSKPKPQVSATNADKMTTDLGVEYSALNKYLPNAIINHEEIATQIKMLELFSDKIAYYSEVYGILKSGGRIFTKYNDGNEASKIFCNCSNCKMDDSSFRTQYSVYERYLLDEYKLLEKFIASNLSYDVKLKVWDNIMGGMATLSLTTSIGDYEMSLKPSNSVEIKIQNDFYYKKILERDYKNKSSMKDCYQKDFQTQKEKFVSQYSHALYKKELKEKTITSIKSNQHKNRYGKAISFFNELVDGKPIDFSKELIDYQTMYYVVAANEDYLFLHFLEGYDVTNANQSRPETIVGPIHFEDRGGTEFERLVFAFVSRLKHWEEIEWLGQTGDDEGRDIWGVFNGETYCYQCANYRKVVFQKAQRDIMRLVDENHIPNYLIVVTGGRVSADMRTKIKQFAVSQNIHNVQVWSGTELEEKIRRDNPDLIRRFVNGETFPELP